MSRKTKQATIDNVVKLATTTYMTQDEIAEAVGISVNVAGRIVRQFVPRENRFNYIDDAAKERIVAAFLAGIGLSGIGRHLGIKGSATTFGNIISKAGYKTRNRSEQQKARMNRCTESEKAALTKKANIAATGRKVPHESKVKRAKSMEGLFNKRSRYEPLVFNSLIEAFPNAIPSMAVDIYNLDIGIGNVAVEVFGGGWSYSDASRVNKYINRTKELAKLGINTLFVILSKESTVIDADNLISQINILSRNPASACEYRVVWGDFNGSTGLCDNLDELAFECPFVNVRDSTTGRYVSVLR